MPTVPTVPASRPEPVAWHDQTGGVPAERRTRQPDNADPGPAPELPRVGSAQAMTLEGHGERVVPVYAVTGGRTRAAGQELPLEAVVTTTGLSLTSRGSLQMESRAIVEMCARPRSLAEVGAALGVPVGVARVLVGDLANGG